MPDRKGIPFVSSSKEKKELSMYGLLMNGPTLETKLLL